MPKTNIFGVEITYETKAELDKKVAELRRKNQLAYTQNVLKQSVPEQAPKVTGLPKVETPVEAPKPTEVKQPEPVAEAKKEEPKVEVKAETKVESKEDVKPETKTPEAKPKGGK